MFQGFSSGNSNTMRADQLFVSVIYDFEYMSEDGNRIFMKENEILLLINKTNHDWWQVIRRGDRRPFYAPAKYVVELRPGEVEAAHQRQHRREMKSRTAASGGGGGGPWQFNANKNRPVFSTFGGKPPSPSTKDPSSASSSHGNKRHSYASPGSRFSERYRSNSLDSILVADLDRSQQAALQQQPVRHSYHMTNVTPAYHIYPAEHHLIPKSQVTLVRGGIGLAKRPTIEGLDKRKSWSLDISSQSRVTSSLNSVSSVPSGAVIGTGSKTSGSVKSVKSGRISSYQNTDGLVNIGARSDASSVSSKTFGTDPRSKKKPVPLPRSKVPVTEKGSSQQQPQPKLAAEKESVSKFFQRSKTDLGSDALSKYKAKKSPGSGSKYPAPRVPIFNRPIPQKRNALTTSPTISEVPVVEKKNETAVEKKVEAASSAEKKTEAASVTSTSQKTASLQRPLLKEKPLFSTFKTSKKVENDEPKTASSSLRPSPSRKDSRMSRAASEGDILGQLIEEEALNENDIVDDVVINETETKHIGVDFRKPRSEPLTITSLPLVDKTSQENVSEWMDKSCSTSFESNESSSMLMSTTNERSTDVSMEDSELFSLESCGGGLQVAGSQLDHSQDRLLMSPCSTTSRSPPSPNPGITPKRQVTEDWDEYEDGLTGRKFYFNPSTKEKSWKPPRKSKGSSEADCSAPTSPCPESRSAYEAATSDEQDNSINDVSNEMSRRKHDSNTVEDVKVPDGYERKTSIDNGSSYFVNVFTGVRWFSAETDAGKVYYYEENGNESCWVLPNVSQSIQDNSPPETTNKSANEIVLGASKSFDNSLDVDESVLNDNDEDAFEIGKVNIIILKQGPLNKTKLVENGKKHRKNWTSSHVVLTDTFLLFFKDAKTFASMQSGGLTKPDHCVDLKGANVAWCTSDKSKRNNVFEVTTALLGITILLQDSDQTNATNWFHEIREVSEHLTRRQAELLDPTSRRLGSDSGLPQTSTLQLPVRKLSGNAASKVNRTTSLKLKFLGSANELDMGPPPPPLASAMSTQSNKVNIREKLRKFFMRRPAMDDLFRRGIMKNEPVFGSTLRELQASDLSDVPLFVKKCVAEIEKGELLKTDGVYRQSGNLSHIQKIRFQVDQGNLAILETVDDVHVLTGALKLFFRELKEPLILWDVVDKLLLACNHQSKKVKLKQMKDCVMSLPQAHLATLAYLLRHLLRVTELKDTNRMQIPNLAIVFGPTLMWPPSNLVSHNLALSMMQQNIIVEALLNNVESIFS